MIRDVEGFGCCSLWYLHRLCVGWLICRVWSGVRTGRKSLFRVALRLHVYYIPRGRTRRGRGCQGVTWTEFTIIRVITRWLSQFERNYQGQLSQNSRVGIYVNPDVFERVGIRVLRLLTLIIGLRAGAWISQLGHPIPGVTYCGFLQVTRLDWSTF